MFDQLSSSQIAELLVRFSLESIVVIGCLLIAWFRLGLKSIVTGMGRWSARFVIAFFLLWTLVQLVDRWQYHFPQPISFYPLARFAMYQTGTSRPSVQSYRLEGEIKGVYRELNPVEHFSAIGLPSLSTRFRVIASAIESNDPDKKNWARNQIKLYGIGIARKRASIGETIPASYRFVVEQWDRQSRSSVDSQVVEFTLLPDELKELRRLSASSGSFGDSKTWLAPKQLHQRGRL